MGATVDQSELDGKLAQLDEAARNQLAVMEKVALEIKKLIQETYYSETDPWNVPWPALSPVTLRERRRRGEPSEEKLIDSKDMFDSIEHHWDATSAEAGYADGLPYTGVQQFGNPFNLAWGGPSAPIPARPSLPLRTPTEVDVPDEWWKRIYLPINEAFAAEVKK